MTIQTLNLKTIRNYTKLGLMLTSSWVLTACSGYGTTGGGLQIGNNAGLSYNGSEFSNGSSTTPVIVQPESNVVVTPVSVAEPATEAQAFSAIEAAHTSGMRVVISAAGQQALAAFDDMSPSGPPVPPSSPYGGVAPPPVTPPTNPVDNPPTGVDNPDKLPVLDASAAKKSGVARAGADLILAQANSVKAMINAGLHAKKADIQKAVQNLEALNLTNLSAETQSMVQGNILILNTILSILN